VIEIEKTIAAIKGLDSAAMEECQTRLDNLIKPLGSLGALEELAVKMAGITQNPKPDQPRKSMVILAGDHGAAVTETNRQLGARMLANAACGTAFINAFARHAEAELVLVDVGLAGNLPAGLRILGHRIANGTKNILIQEAMTLEETLAAIKIGLRIAEKEISRGVKLIGLSEIGLGSNIAAQALVAACAEKSAPAMKNHSAATLCLKLLAKLGGLETGAQLGVILGAAKGRAAVIIDGASAEAAALIAVKMAPLTQGFLMASLKSQEPYRQKALDMLGLRAHIDFDPNLSQGCGAAVAMSLVKAGIHVLNDMKTFAESGVAVAQDGLGKFKQKSGIALLNN
jgi:nicotinate-nucleotide--dimethylbenzimidazole phosphoribosyltransferase